MIRDAEKLRAFEEQLSADTPIDVEQNFRLANDLYERARKLNILPLADPLEGLEEKIQFVKILNALRRVT